MEGMTLAAAKEILAKPKGRGRPSAQRIEAERVVAASDHQVAVDAGLRPDDGGQDALSSLIDTAA